MPRTPAGGLVARINGRDATMFPITATDYVRPRIIVDDKDLAKLLGNYTFRELALQLGRVQLWACLPGEGLLEKVDVFLRPQSSSEEEFRPYLSFALAHNLAEWMMPWTFRTYFEAVDAVARARGLNGAQGLGTDTSDPSTNISLDCFARSQDTVLGEEIRYWTEIVRSIDGEAKARLIAAQHADSLVEIFQFPPAIAIACEQYLLYFVQFLADLGIKAAAEVQHTSAQVLFRVTPAEGREALARVREALDAYLRLPTDPSLALVPSSGQDPAVWELKAVVRHLRDRVAFQQDVLEAKNATIAAQAHSIEALELSNYRLRELAGGEVKMMGKGAAAAAGEDDSEAIIPRAISVKRYEIGPIVFEMPEILRMLKRRFGG